MIDAARRKGKTLADLREIERELLLGNGLRTQRCKAIGIDKEEETIIWNFIKYSHTSSICALHFTPS